MFVMDHGGEDVISGSNEEKKSVDLPPKDNNIVPEPCVETVVWTEPPKDTNLQGVANAQHDLHTFGPQYSCQPHQEQPPYPEYLLYQQSQQYNPYNSSITAGDNSQPSSTSWFTADPIMCSMMPGEIHTSEPNVCVTLPMDHQRFEEGLCIDNNQFAQPVMYNGTPGEQILLMNPEPGPVFLTLENAPLQRNDSLCQDNELVIMGNHNQVCPPASRQQTADTYRQVPASVPVRSSREMRSRKACHCTRSSCLKLYCECFSSGVMCKNCNCSNCHNNTQHQAKREKAIKSCLIRNPDAFRPKIAGGKSGEVKGWHSKGCNCKRSGCLKNYCECYEANIMCTSSCKCVGCRNFDRSSVSQKVRGPTSVITPAVVETVCGCLLARAEEAEKEQHNEAGAQVVILNEFGHCLTHIITAMFKKYPY